VSGWKVMQAEAAHALAKGDLSRAAQLLVDAIELEPAEPRLYEQLIRVALLGGATETAVRAAVELRRLGEGNVKFAWLHAMALVAHGDAAEAEAVLAQVLELQPGHPDATRALAQLARQQGDPARAVELLEAPARAAPHDVGLTMDLCAALLEAGRAAEARAMLEPLVAAHPSDTGLRLAAARACAKLGDPVSARAHAHRARDTDDDDVRQQAVHLVRELDGLEGPARG
jgi:tetratricopeptide (TPR) repeat protein